MASPSFKVRDRQSFKHIRGGGERSLIDFEYFPHVRDAILSHAPVTALRALRATSRDMKKRVDELAPTHVELRPRDTVINVVNGRVLPSSWKTDKELTGRVRFLDFPSANTLPLAERSSCLCNCLGLYCATNLERHKNALTNLEVVRFIGDTNCYTANFDCKKVVFVFRADSQPHFYQAEFPFPTLVLNFRYRPEAPIWPMGSKWPLGNRAPFIPYKPRGDLVFIMTPRETVEGTRGPRVATPVLMQHGDESDESEPETEDEAEEVVEEAPEEHQPPHPRGKLRLRLFYMLRRIRRRLRRAPSQFVDDDDGFHSIIDSDEGFHSFLECLVNVMCWSTRTITIVGSDEWDALFPLSDGEGPRTLLERKMTEMFCDWRCTTCTKPDDHPCRYQDGRLRLLSMDEYRTETGEDVFSMDCGDCSNM